MDSILTSIKKLLGIAEEYTHFDADLIIHINSVFLILTQLGVGPSEGFRIEDDVAVWTDFVAPEEGLDAVKTYVHHKVRLLFDPPDKSSVMQAMNETIKELEWRLNLQAESNKT